MRLWLARKLLPKRYKIVKIVPTHGIGPDEIGMQTIFTDNVALLNDIVIGDKLFRRSGPAQPAE